jgi:hypothetical protein
MNDYNEQLISDFINGRGSFSDMDNYVDPQDLSAAKFYHSAAKQILSRAKTEKSHAERKRLMALAQWQFEKVERILERYGL